MLIRTFKRLGAARPVTRTSSGQVSPRVDHLLTDLGWSLSLLVKNLDHWVEQHAKAIAASLRS
jgi:DNA-binding HxlR family transcriptional regulator